MLTKLLLTKNIGYSLSLSLYRTPLFSLFVIKTHNIVDSVLEDRHATSQTHPKMPGLRHDDGDVEGSSRLGSHVDLGLLIQDDAIGTGVVDSSQFEILLGGEGQLRGRDAIVPKRAGLVQQWPPPHVNLGRWRLWSAFAAGYRDVTGAGKRKNTHHQV